jgi:hypothetical protein
MLTKYRKARPDDPVYMLVLAGDPAERVYRALGFEPVAVFYELGLPPEFGVGP